MHCFVQDIKQCGHVVVLMFGGRDVQEGYCVQSLVLSYQLELIEDEVLGEGGFMVEDLVFHVGFC